MKPQTYKYFPRKNPSVSEALKENAEALSNEEPSQALWKKKDGMWRRWENMLWHKEELWNAINTNEHDLFLCGSCFDDRIVFFQARMLL